MGSDLRNQFLNYMTLQRFSPNTKRSYLTGVKGLARFYKQPPDKLNPEQVQDYFRHLMEDRQVAWGTCNAYLSGIVCFYRNICKWEDAHFDIPPRPRIKKLPTALSVEEVKRLFASAANLKHRVLLKTAYSAGLRVGELIRLQPHHIESDPSRMLIRVEQGKGRKDRYTVLSEHLLEELRLYWRKYQPDTWLFPGQKRGKHLTDAGAQRAYYLAKKKPA